MPDPKLQVEIGAVITNLERNLAKATKDLQKFSDKTKVLGKRFQSVGKQMTIGLTLPLAIFGGVAAKSFASFEKELSKIEGLVGIAGDKVAEMGKKANEMASDFGKSGKEAVEALFFITSAGLRGQEAMDVLEQSLKASVIGLGETKVVADLATSAMNAYGSEVLSAADATDILTTAVREGKLDAAALGSAMGQVLPIASAMGVTFNEVGAAFAAMSRTGTDAAVAATQLKGILASLLAPTTEAEKALSKMGLSSEMLRQNIKEKGLLDTLEILNDKFDGNEAAAATVFGSIRALSGVMDLMGKNIDGTREIFDSLNNSMGATDEAFKVTAQTADFKFNKAMKGITNQIKGFGKAITETLLPVFEKLAGALKRTLEAFNNLSPAWKKTIVVIGLLVAALGPLLAALGFLMTTVVPGLITVFGFLSATVLPATITAFRTLTTAMLANPVGLIITAVTVLTVAFLQFIQTITPAVSKLKTLWNIIKAGGNQAAFIALQMEDVAQAMMDETEAADAAAAATKKLKDEQADAAKQAAKLTEELLKQTKVLDTTPSRPKASNVATTLFGITDTSGGAKDDDELAPITTFITEAEIRLGELLLLLQNFNEEANNLIVGSIADTFGQLGDAIGIALAEGGNVLQAIGQTILASLRQFLSEMGGLLIKYGTLAVLKGKLDLAILAGGPVAIGAGLAAIAVGIALKAAGAAIGQFAAKGSSNDSRNFSGATGGSGDISSRQGSINNVSGGFGGGTVVFEIAGTKLVGVLTNTLTRNKALGGSTLTISS